jgi:hypothetical protein
LVVVAALGMAATIAWRVPGLVLTAPAAGIVWAGTAATHHGSPAARIAARRRWRVRTRDGLTTWTPPACRTVAGLVPTQRDRGRNVFGAERAVPDAVAGFAWLDPDPAAVGIVWHTPPGAPAYATAAFAVEGMLAGTATAAAVDAAAVGFGDLLARLAAPQMLCDRLQVLTRHAPTDPGAHLAWLAGHADPDADPALLAAWTEVVEQASASTTARHFVVARWPLTTGFTTAATRRGPGRLGWSLLLAEQITNLTGLLTGAGFVSVRPLTVAGTAGLLRHLQNPAWPIEDLRELDVTAPWTRSTEDWSSLLTTGLDPDGAPVSWWHRTAVVPIEALTGGARTPIWVGPLLWQMPDAVIRTFSIQLEPVPAGAARHAARMDLTADLADLAAGAERGVLTDDELAVAAAAARARVADLAPGSGQHGLNWVAHLSVSAPDRPGLIEACARITDAAAEAGITRLDWLDTAQGPAAACTWPLARGMRTARPRPATALRRLLAGHGPKDAL